VGLATSKAAESEAKMGTQGRVTMTFPCRFDQFAKVSFRARRTFDSSRAPKVSRRANRPARYATVAHELLHRRMIETLERVEADDPMRLRRRIDELEQQFASHSGRAEKYAETVHVETPVEVPTLLFDPRYVQRLDNTCRVCVGRSSRSDAHREVRTAASDNRARSSIDLSPAAIPPTAPRPPGRSLPLLTVGSSSTPCPPTCRSSTLTSGAGTASRPPRSSGPASLAKTTLRAKAISAFRRLQKMPRLVRGFFREPHLAYITA
jgi:hypothetical protein